MTRRDGRTFARRCALAALGLVLAFPAAAEEVAGLHVPSPDWRDQVIYFVMIDRFDDGDPGNNDQGAGEYDPADSARYSGGDLRGIARRLDYIRDLGATAVWITPPVAHQWWNEATRYGGYHGYWAEDFKAVDPHFGTLEEYRALSRALHDAGMYLVQDVVVNHTANFFAYGEGWDEGDPARHFELIADARGRTAPTQPPFDRNDPRDPAQHAEAIYHWTPDIADFGDRRQELEFALAGLDDLNTENPRVRTALRDSYGHWIREVGVDAFRVDTAFHVPADFFPDFLHGDDAEAPGVVRVARATGREDFLSFGEGFGADKPFDDTQARKLDAYMRVPGGLPSMINFPLYGTLGDVFARGRPTAELRHRIESMMALHDDPWRMPSFIDNHDVDRFLAGAGEPAMRQALLAMLTLPGIPVIYYGTEQGFTGQRAAMFADGYGSGGRDRFDREAPLYRYLQRAIALRRDHPLFSRGTPTVLADNAASAGAVAWRTDHAGESALVVFNTADAPVLLDALDTGLPAGTVLRGLFALDGTPDDAVVGRDGHLTRVLPPRSGQVWRVTAETVAAPEPAMAPAVGPLPPRPARGDFAVQGTAPGAEQVQLVIDGDLARAVTVPVAADGGWRANVATGGMIDPAVTHRLVVRDPASGAVSTAQTFRADLDWQALADLADARGDDAGPDGRYVYPSGSGWRELRPADIERVRVWGAGGALRVALTMRGLGDAWNPGNGFDHVAFTLFLQLPGHDGGAAAMPQQHARLPDGMRWHRRLRAHGWSNVLFSAEGADAAEEGTPVTPGADIAVDREDRTVTFTLPAGALGDPASLSGAKLYVATWDYDGGYRPLAPEARPAGFGGGDPDDPRIMDDTEVIILPP
ncbi:alpha-amylase family glycosyl hydrolase [Luteimonas suaedae]|uniref:alpha-amylase family glycosyl hydrolase n=1 Tax=Luteimonas suaedae TaxID=2605430 RepID=UPI0011EFE81B|nr:alpha-amylase family glycosyl hydrolase [Luteimonas suaedae]